MPHYFTIYYWGFATILMELCSIHAFGYAPANLRVCLPDQRRKSRPRRVG